MFYVLTGMLTHPIKMVSLTWSTLVKAGHVGVETGYAGAHVMGVGDPLWEEEKLQVARRITLAILRIHYILVAMVTGSSRGTWGEPTKIPGPTHLSIAASDRKLGRAWEREMMNIFFSHTYIVLITLQLYLRQMCLHEHL